MLDSVGKDRPPVSFDPALLKAATVLARLPLSEARAAALLPTLDGVFQMLAALDPASLGETPPAFSFKARWEA